MRLVMADGCPTPPEPYSDNAPVAECTTPPVPVTGTEASDPLGWALGFGAVGATLWIAGIMVARRERRRNETAGSDPK